MCCKAGEYTSLATSLCPTGYTYSIALNSCYLFSSATKTWNDASQYCKANGSGRLVTISSQQENDYVVSIASGYTNIWIGYNDIKSEGVFVWEDGSETSSYTNWDTKQPDNWQNNEDCGQIWSGGKWNDNVCTYYFQFVCEANAKNVCNKCPAGTRQYSYSNSLLAILSLFKLK
jgi:hypothetical protein